MSPRRTKHRVPLGFYRSKWVFTGCPQQAGALKME